MTVISKSFVRMTDNLFFQGVQPGLPQSAYAGGVALRHFPVHKFEFMPIGSKYHDFRPRLAVFEPSGWLFRITPTTDFRDYHENSVEGSLVLMPAEEAERDYHERNASGFQLKVLSEFQSTLKSLNAKLNLTGERKNSVADIVSMKVSGSMPVALHVCKSNIDGDARTEFWAMSDNAEFVKGLGTALVTALRAASGISEAFRQEAQDQLSYIKEIPLAERSQFIVRKAGFSSQRPLSLTN